MPDAIDDMKSIQGELYSIKDELRRAKEKSNIQDDAAAYFAQKS